MSSSYFITFYRAEDIAVSEKPELDYDVFIQKLRQNWQDTDVRISNGAIVWRLGFWEGQIQTSTNVVFMNASVSHQVVAFANWYRTFIPLEKLLFLYHTSSMEDFLRLTKDTTQQEIRAWVG